VSSKTEKNLDYICGYEICKAVEFTIFLGAKKRLYKRLRWSVRWLVGPSVRRSPRSNYVENCLRRDCFKRRRRKRILITSRFHYVAIPLRRDSFAPRD
jgi:hypothetical protein